MGADLLLCVLERDADRGEPTLSDWEAALRSAQQAESLYRYPGADAADADERLVILDILREACDVLPPNHSRDVVTWSTVDGRSLLYITGGVSWGDDPTDAYRIFEALLANDDVAGAAGFRVPGDSDRAPLAVAGRIHGHLPDECEGGLCPWAGTPGRVPGTATCAWCGGPDGDLEHGCQEEDCNAALCSGCFDVTADPRCQDHVSVGGRLVEEA